MAEKASADPLPPRLTALLRESWWLLAVGAAAYLCLVLFTYDKGDPGWSHSVSRATVRNGGGEAGAWVADLLLALFGVSAYWWVAFFAFAVLWSYRRIEAATLLADRRPLAVAGIGFIILLLSSAGVEALRLHSLKIPLPFAPGGVVGALVAKSLSSFLGFIGATLLLLVTMAVGLSLFTGLSWIKLSERLGEALEQASRKALQAWRDRQDRKVGALALVRREESVEETKKHWDEHDPVRIEPPVAGIPKSERVQREKQAPLFAELPDSPLPPLRLLDQTDQHVEALGAETLEYTSRLIEKKLLDFGVEVRVLAAYPGPVITRYEMEPAVGVKGSQIINLVKDLARALSVVSIRVVETIPGKSCMGLEIPNPKREVVRLAEVLGSRAYGDAASSALTIALGKDIGGQPVVADLARMPHVLVAGTTGSGKSVAINAMILSLLYKASPEQVRLLLVDPKMLELSVYDGIPHLLTPVVTDMKQASQALGWCVAEMDRRYKTMSALGVRNLAGLNHKIAEAKKHGQFLPHPLSLHPEDPEPLEPMPYIVVVIDELADLMMVVGKKVEELIARLAQKARAAGVHLVLATQRPSVDVITGLIKTNIPSRIAFQVQAKVDSRIILDQMGAEALLGQGDMLYLPPGTGYPQRVHGAFVADQEVHRVVDYLKAQGQPSYVPGVLEGGDEDNGEAAAAGDGESDPLYDQAVAIVLQSRRASISLVQRHLRVGYNRAARLLEQMERSGVVSAMQGNGNREVLAPQSGER